MPHLIAGELPCISFCVNYAEIGDFVFLKYCVMLNLQNTRFFNVIFPNKKPQSEAMSVCLLYDHAYVLYSEEQILVVFINFRCRGVSFDILTGKSLYFSLLWRFFRDCTLTNDKTFYPHCKTRFIVEMTNFLDIIHRLSLIKDTTFRGLESVSVIR
jgi:hypothetical protein